MSTFDSYAFLNAYTIIDRSLVYPIPISHAYNTVPVSRSTVFIIVYDSESAPGVSVPSFANPLSQQMIFDGSLRSATHP